MKKDFSSFTAMTGTSPLLQSGLRLQFIETEKLFVSLGLWWFGIHVPHEPAQDNIRHAVSL